MTVDREAITEAREEEFGGYCEEVRLAAGCVSATAARAVLARLETVEAERDAALAGTTVYDLDAELRDRASAWETVARQLADALVRIVTVADCTKGDGYVYDPPDFAESALAAFRALDTPETPDPLLEALRDGDPPPPRVREDAIAAFTQRKDDA